jgi:GNAT superfamily N-acetyltransferase
VYCITKKIYCQIFIVYVAVIVKILEFVYNKTMITKQITTVGAKDNKQLEILYKTSFPKQEQIPWDEFVPLIDKMSLDFTVYYEKDEIVGFTVVFPYKTFNWFWYFAVKPELRGQGKGQEILTAVIQKYKGKKFVLDLESTKQECENMEQRIKRHAFYLRNGFKDTNIYKKYDDIEMTVMALEDSNFTMQDWDELFAELRKFWTWD